ncbi:MAG: helix-turn-helix domain-containing protein [Dehalococcoidia bacterium]
MWLRRYEKEGEQGLRNRSSRPSNSPRATSAEVTWKIMYLRQSYHFGPHKIAMYLKRYHEITISPSGIRRVLCRLDMSRLPSSQRHKRHEQRWKRYEKPQPGHVSRST